MTFSAITGLNLPVGAAIFGNDLFVANNGTNTVGEYNATTGAVINANFVTGVNGSYGLAVLGSQLLVVWVVSLTPLRRDSVVLAARVTMASCLSTRLWVARG